MRIIADNTIPFLKGILEPVAEVTYLNSVQFTPTAVRMADALIVRSIDKCARTLLEGSRIRLITTATIGYDHIDTAFCEAAGIEWKNAPGSNATSVAQYLVSCLLTLSVRNGEPLKGKTIGIVGVGHVGKEVERHCAALGMNILRNDPPRAEMEGDAGFVSLHTIAEEADIVTFHVPLTHEGRFATYHLADEAFFHSLRKRPWFVNAARGSVHNTAALRQACRDGKISAMILDCWENEPFIDRALLQDAAIATPHIAGFSADGKANATRMCLEAIASFFGITLAKIGEVLPPPPIHPVVDLNLFTSHRMAHAVWHSYNPLATDRALRSTPERFEWFRNNYPHPREFAAYAIKNATPEEVAILRVIGFR